jgi:hypothetical protein
MTLDKQKLRRYLWMFIPQTDGSNSILHEISLTLKAFITTEDLVIRILIMLLYSKFILGDRYAF